MEIHVLIYDNDNGLSADAFTTINGALKHFKETMINWAIIERANEELIEDMRAVNLADSPESVESRLMTLFEAYLEDTQEYDRLMIETVRVRPE